MMNREEGINDLPPEQVSTMQLLMLVRDLRQESIDNREERKRMTQAIADLGIEVAKIRKSFDGATTVVKMIKWMAAFGVATIGLVEAIRRMVPWH